MEATRIVSGVLKLWVLAVIAGGIYFLWRSRAAPPLENDIEQAENISHTNVDVTLGTIRKMTLHGYVVGYGNVEPAPASKNEPAADARLSVDWPATITEVKCVEGEQVAKGQDLLSAMRAKMPDAGVNPYVDTMKSPIAGTVVMLNVHTGEVALPTTTAVEVVATDRLVVAAGIPAWEADKIAVGQAANVELPGHAAANEQGGAATKFESKVQRIDRAVDPKTNLVSVDVGVPAKQLNRAGGLARVSISTEQVDCLAVPAEAIVRDSLDRPYVGVVSDDHKQATLRLIRPGLREGDWVQISGDGIEADETIVTGGAYALQYRNDIHVLNP